MASDWYCNMSGDVSGPLTDAQLRELVAGGYLSPDDFVRGTAQGEWVSAGRVKGLFSRGEAPDATGGVAAADKSTEGLPAKRLPVAKAVSGPPPLARAKPPGSQSGIAPRDGMYLVDAAKTGNSARSGIRKRRRRLIASPPVLAVSTALIVLLGVIYWLSRTETEPLRSGEDVSTVETRSGPPEPKSARQAAFDAAKGLDVDELDRLISTPPDGRKPREPAKTGTAAKEPLVTPLPESRPERSVTAAELVTPLGPRTRQGPEQPETMAEVPEDDGYSPIPIPGLTGIDDDHEPASDVEKRDRE